MQLSTLTVAVLVSATAFLAVYGAGWTAGTFPLSGSPRTATIDDTAYFLDPTYGQFAAWNATAQNYTHFPDLSGRSFARMVAAGRKLVIAGGHDPDNHAAPTTIYDVDTRVWILNVTGPTCGRVQDIYTFSTGAYDANVSALSVARTDLATASFGTKLFQTACFNTIDIYDAASNTWSVAPIVLSVPQSQAGGGYIAGLVFFAGGRLVSNLAVDTVDVYNLTSGVMSTAQPLAGGIRVLICVARAGTQLLFAGGDTGDDTSRALDTYESSYCVGIANPCLHGGACVSGLAGYTCACVASYTGPNCQTAPATGGSTGSGTGGGSTGALSGTGSAVGHKSFATIAVTVVAVSLVLSM